MKTQLCLKKKNNKNYVEVLSRIVEAIPYIHKIWNLDSIISSGRVVLKGPFQL